MQPSPPLQPGDLVVVLVGRSVLMSLDRIEGVDGCVSWNTPTGRIGCRRYPLRWLARVRRARHEFERG